MHSPRQISALIFFAFLICSSSAHGQGPNVSLGTDFVSRYIWRGINANDAVNIQPSLSVEDCGFAFGFWGSYSFSNNNKSDQNYRSAHEIDTWLSYTKDLRSGSAITLIATDYYFANSGVSFTDIGNYDSPDGPGAHTVELGLELTGPTQFPITLSGYVNVYNDPGNDTYFEIDYPARLTEVAFNFFAGASAGSIENPSCYGTDKFALINIGVKATKTITITKEFSIPLSVSYIVNPNAGRAYLVLGLSL